MNLGLFPVIMMAIYPVFFTGEEWCGMLLAIGRRLRGTGAWERYFQPARPGRRFSLWATLPHHRPGPLPASGSGLPPYVRPDVRRGPYFAVGAFGMVVLSLAMGYHSLSVALRLFQAPPPLFATRTALIELLQTDQWLTHSRTWQDWGMFPSPPRSSGDLETTIVDEKSKEHVLPKYLPFEKKTVELAYDRERKLRRRIAREDGKQFRRPWAMFQCREFELRTGTRPRRVILHDIGQAIPPPASLAKTGPVDALKLPLKRENVGTFSCSGSGRLPAYIKERRGLPVTAAERRQEEAQQARLRRTYPKAPYRKPEPKAPSAGTTGKQSVP